MSLTQITVKSIVYCKAYTKGEFCCGKKEKNTFSKNYNGSCLADDYCYPRYRSTECCLLSNGLLILYSFTTVIC